MDNRHYKKKVKGSKKRQVGVKLPIYFLSLVIVALLSFGASRLLADQEEVPSFNGADETSDSPASMGAVEGAHNLEAVYEIILNNYIEEVDEEDLVEGALQGMVNAIEDPYSQYLNVQESESLDESISASFEGIGAEIMSMNDQIIIVSPIKGSPAEKAGLLPNDVVLSADGESLAGMTATEAVNLIRGEKGTSVELEIQRGSQTFKVEIFRDTIPIETVTYEIDESNPEVGLIAVHSFARPTYDEIVEAVTALRDQGAGKFIFDFRQNPGGLLDQAMMIGNMFVEDGEILLQTEEKEGNPQPIYASDEEFGDFQITEPTVMLIDEGSASASEIVAGVLQEAADIPLVGTTSFGKGTVQSIYPLTADSELKLTVAKWLTPEGNWIHDEGIKPDYEVELPEYAFLTIIDTTAEYKLGEVSEAVLNVEKMLEAMDYTVTADGYFDEATISSLEEFQAEESLPVTGELTEDTAVAMVNRLREVIEENDTQYQKALEVIKELNGTNEKND
ncbi:S41 family peptidase [Jeotgalibaca caeni]|uniref:S41 family peptidase n=1 Tax=Jeotgalibaca caeni TaxID=3028623 RepID=UPI00237E480B|nr:S41 family peptidase [Jeotgalibaca caeni]MDE1548455.1 S41 family peptidase [Jeotgalibaca caeni]